MRSKILMIAFGIIWQQLILFSCSVRRSFQSKSYTGLLWLSAVWTAAVLVASLWSALTWSTLSTSTCTPRPPSGRERLKTGSDLYNNSPVRYFYCKLSPVRYWLVYSRSGYRGTCIQKTFCFHLSVYLLGLSCELSFKYEVSQTFGKSLIMYVSEWVSDLFKLYCTLLVRRTPSRCSQFLSFAIIRESDMIQWSHNHLCSRRKFKYFMDSLINYKGTLLVTDVFDRATVMVRSGEHWSWRREGVWGREPSGGKRARV